MNGCDKPVESRLACETRGEDGGKSEALVGRGRPRSRRTDARSTRSFDAAGGWTPTSLLPPDPVRRWDPLSEGPPGGAPPKGQLEVAGCKVRLVETGRRPTFRDYMQLLCRPPLLGRIAITG